MASSDLELRRHEQTHEVMPVRVEGHVDRIDFIAQLCRDRKHPSNPGRALGRALHKVRRVMEPHGARVLASRNAFGAPNYVRSIECRNSPWDESCTDSRANSLKAMMAVAS